MRGISRVWVGKETLRVEPWKGLKIVYYPALGAKGGTDGELGGNGYGKGAFQVF